MKKNILLILIGIIICACGRVSAYNMTYWSPANYLVVKNDNISEVQIWCELRSQRDGVEKYCSWNGKNYYLTCLGQERLYGTDIKGDENGNYKCINN